MFVTAPPTQTPPSCLLVLPQFEPCKLVGHLERLLQALCVPARGLCRHVFAASLAVQQGTQLLNPLAGLQATVSHILQRRKVEGGKRRVKFMENAQSKASSICH